MSTPEKSDLTNTAATPAAGRSDDDWRRELTPEEYHVLRQAGTERPYTGEYWDTHTAGAYNCRACGTELFTSKEKFRFALRLAVILGAPRRRAGAVHPRPNPGHGTRRGPVRQLRFPPRARLRGRGLRDSDRPAFLHQLHLTEAGSGRREPPGLRLPGAAPGGYLDSLEHYNFLRSSL
jgi:hypothetical protein